MKIKIDKTIKKMFATAATDMKMSITVIIKVVKAFRTIRVWLVRIIF